MHKPSDEIQVSVGECCVSCQKLWRFKCFEKPILFSLTETKTHAKKCPTQRQDLPAAFSTCSQHQLLIHRCFVMRRFNVIQTRPLVLMADTLRPVSLHSTLTVCHLGKYTTCEDICSRHLKMKWVTLHCRCIKSLCVSQ